MFLKNVSKTFQSFSYNDGKRQRQIAPGETATLLDAKEDDVAIQTLVSFGAVEIVDGPDSAPKKGEPVVLAGLDDVHENDVMSTVKCPAVFKNGNPCTAVIQLAEGEAYEDAPRFCGRHTSENPEDYELVDGTWTKVAKKSAKNVEEKPAEAPQAAPEAKADADGAHVATVPVSDDTSPLTASTARPVFDNE